MVKDKTYEMGVIKALGGKNFNLSIIFVMQVIAVGLLTCILSWIGLGLFLGAANDILVASLSQLASTNIVTDLDFLIFNPGIMSLNCLGIIVLSVISTLAPINKLRKIKPINIIKASE
jgi:ABC-type lipoprotein release transport system permease subunit